MVMDVSSSNMHPGIVDAGRQLREMVRVALPSARQKSGLDIPLLWCSVSYALTWGHTHSSVTEMYLHCALSHDTDVEFFLETKNTTMN